MAGLVDRDPMGHSGINEGGSCADQGFIRRCRVVRRIARDEKGAYGERQQPNIAATDVQHKWNLHRTAVATMTELSR